MKRARILVICLMTLCPLLYLYLIWNGLPEQVPIHFNIKGEADRIGKKAELLWLVIFLVGLNLGTFATFVFSAKLNPKKKYAESNQQGINKIAFAVSIFLTVITLFVIHSVNKATNGSLVKGDFVLSAVGLLICVMGNYMYNLKPNYSVGIRIISTLKDENNWKKTHHLGGKLWFWGGLLIAVVCALLASKAAFIFFFIVFFLLAAIPIIYSIRMEIKRKSDS